MAHDEYDVFVCYSGDERESVVIPIVEACEAIGLVVFVDKDGIKWGDSITEKINLAIAHSKYFLAVISSTSVNKSWPMRELNSAIAREIECKQKILPLIIGDSQAVLKELPLIKDKLYLKWEDNPNDVAKAIKALVLTSSTSSNRNG